MEYISDAVRNIYRRGLRSILAVFGVAVGVFAFLMMGAMAEHFNRIAFTFHQLFENRVFLSERPSFWAGGGILSMAKESQARDVPGVSATVPLLISRRQSDMLLVVGVPQMVIGIPGESLHYLVGDFTLLQGKARLPGPGSAVLGADSADEAGVSPGGMLEFEGERFRVEGILARTGGLVDGQMFIPLPDAQRIFNREGLVTSILVVPDEGVDPEALSARLQQDLSGVRAISPAQFREQVNRTLSLYNAITFGASAVAVLAGALCVMIVMFTTLSERTPEIGIRKAVGAEDSQIIREFLAESAILTLSGWVVGCVASIFFVKIAEAWTIRMGSVLFYLSGRLFVASLTGVLILGILAGLVPAWQASRVDPVIALRGRL